MTFDWRVDIGTVLSAVGMVAALIAGLYTLVTRLCARLEQLDNRQAEVQMQLTTNALENVRRFDEIGRDVRELRRWLMADRAGGEEGR